MAEDQIYRGQSPAEFGLWRRRARDGVMLFSVPVQGETWQESSQQNLDGLIPLVDRVTVAPDRETLARHLFEIATSNTLRGLGLERHQGPDWIDTDRQAWLRDADALLASGVLGVPADQIRAEQREADAQIVLGWHREYLHQPLIATQERLAEAIRAAEYRKAGS